MKTPAKIMPIIHWILTITLGFTLIDNSIPLILILLSIFSFILAWFFAVGINDYYDLEIDRITNPERPLVTEALSGKDVKNFFIISAIASFSLAVVCDVINAKIGITILISINLLLGVLYSMPPIRIKSKTPFSSIVIGLVTSECILVGGMLGIVTNLVIAYAIILGFIVTFISAAKDFKDIEGDKAAGIPTIAANYGAEKAGLVFQIINIIGYSSLLLLYFFQNLPLYFIIFIFACVIINFFLFQFYRTKPSQKKGELIYKLGFLLYMICTVLLIIINY